jgi:hypothetical protein
MEQIRITDDIIATHDKWLETCKSCDYATFFHTPLWYDIFYEYSQGAIRPACRIITFSDNSSAIIPLAKIVHAGGLYKTYVSSPAGTFGGWVSKDKLSKEHAVLLTGYILSLDNIFWRENPYDPYLNEVDMLDSAEDFTQTIDLKKSKEELFAVSSRAHVKAVNKALREGVSVREAQSADDWKEHFDNYGKSTKRWERAGTAKKNVRPYGWRLFEAIRTKYPDYSRLWCAVYDNKIAASVICFYWNRHAVAWHGSASEDFFNLRPNNILYQHMIIDAREKGYEWFDCNTPGGLKGVVEFKEHLGTIKKRSRFLDKTTLSRKIFRGIKKILR